MSNIPDKIHAKVLVFHRCLPAKLSNPQWHSANTYNTILLVYLS